jgi:hypothetical protein
MTRKLFRSIWLVAAVVATGLSASALSATEEDEIAGLVEEEGPLTTLKKLTCTTAGCTTGDQKCADIKGEIKNPTGTGTLSVTWYCYEGGKTTSGGGATYTL